MLVLGFWYALQVRPFHERMSEKILTEKGYDTFLPTYVRRASGRESKDRELALFPGYIFCRFMSETNGKILTTSGVIRVVGIGKQPVPVPDQEIEHVRAVIQSGLPQQPWRSLPQGSRVRIESGPMQSLEGVLVSCGTGRRLVVTITILQRSVGVELDSTTVVSVVRRPLTNRCNEPERPRELLSSSCR